MSIKHATLCELIEDLYLGSELTPDGVRLLETYAAPTRDLAVSEQLDRDTVRLVEGLTGAPEAYTPALAARALLGR
jgi:hypothetical protein